MQAVQRGIAVVLTVAVAVLSFAGCGETTPKSSHFFNATQASALAALPDGGLLVGERLSGAVWMLDSRGNAQKTPVAQLTVSNGGERGLLGLAVDDQNRAFASWTDSDKSIVIGQILPGPTRVIWRGPTSSDIDVGGRIAFSPAKRLTLGIGDLQDHAKVSDANAYNGKVVTLDPAGDATQQPNIVSTGWTNPMGLTYDRSGSLWIADGGSATTQDRLARAGTNGPSGNITPLSRDSQPSGLTAYGDQELALCARKTHVLQRFLLQDARAVSGRILARDCTNGITQLRDGSLAYSTDTEVKVTAR